MSCVKNAFAGIGCLVVLVVAAVAGFVYRDRLVAIYHRVRGTPEPPPAVYVRPAPGAAAQAETALGRLTRRGGAAWVDITAAQLAALIEREAAASGARVLDSVAVALGDQHIQVRGSLDVSVLPRRLLGPLAQGLDRREPVVAGGTLAAQPDGRVLWTIDELKIGNFPFPRSVIPAILHAMSLTDAQGAAVPIPLPAGVGDVRVSPSGVRVYRAVPR
jgi:hypothetical protein